MTKKRILVAPLNWGLGHATRCIPIINELQRSGFETLIASDGAALELLKKEFPDLIHFELPSYNIQYSRKATFLKWKIMRQLPHLYKTIQAEKKRTEVLVEKHSITGIISDNRLGVRSKNLNKNIYITHQLNVLNGIFTNISSYLHQRYIQNFDQCWVPDLEGEINLSGKLGHPATKPENLRYTGVLSRLRKKAVPVKYDFLIILSGPEPQRGILEEILLKEFQHSDHKILFIRGVINDEVLNTVNPNIDIRNYMFGSDLEEAFNGSKHIISRSGYTSLMDMAEMDKKAFLIPTPGQPEQTYLAKRLEKLNIAPYCMQEDFKLDKLKVISHYKGLGGFGGQRINSTLFTFFEGE
ncbi:glycosyltransferase [Christiangramia salexigens]|uniref:Glycosyltransferase n=2 Tax=Christiangramia salexigens TaxID=1913577 RepID=A0A1L3J8I0_9FLAO|nr:glycosyltransferase [Christiangramia salexigens]